MSRLLVERFPELKGKIEKLSDEDCDFRQLCDEYEEIAQALRFWKRLVNAPLKQINRQIDDNQTLLQELETEIMLSLRALQEPDEDECEEK